MIGFALVIMIAVIGLTNDLNTLQGPGLQRSMTLASVLS